MFRTPKYDGPERRKTPRWRPRPFRVFISLLLLLLFTYGAAVVWLMAQETNLVFQAGRALSSGRPSFPYEQIDLPRADGARQFAWVMTREGAGNLPWVLFLHGNAATIASRVNIAHYGRLRSMGLNVLAPEYRGFAGLDGVPTEAALAADARAAYDDLRVTRGIPPSRIVVYGWSLGSAVAVDLASKVDEAAVILEGAPASLVDIGQMRYPFFPIRLLMRNPFESIRKIDRIHAPMLFLHSPEDEIVPIGEARRLYNAAHGDKTFVEVRGGHINASEVDAGRFAAAIAGFLTERHVLASAAADAGQH